jgi:cytochrome c oxidase subunit 2
MRGRSIRGWIVAACFIAGVSAHPPADDGRRVVRVRAERFSFTPSEIRVKPGEEIEFRIKSDDTDHGFKIADTDIDIVIPKRGQGETSVVFAATKPGRYEFTCTRLCGAGHSYMRGVIVVKPDSGPDTGARR